jgi:hypothetical protein
MRCLNCDQIVDDEDFCSDFCRSEWEEVARDNAEADFLEWGVSGPPDTPQLDPPHWHER